MDNQKHIMLVPSDGIGTKTVIYQLVPSSAVSLKRIWLSVLRCIFPKTVERIITRDFLRELYKEGAVSKEQLDTII